MDIAEQIERFKNPQEFTKLCNAVFTALYPNDFQIIDGAQSDGGNDGYIQSEQRMLQFYCPAKPAKVNNKKYWEKIESDLKKAYGLHKDGKWIVERWTFVTPQALSNAVLEKMNELGSRLDMEVNHLEATFLADALLRHPHLLERFPSLNLFALNEDIKSIRLAIEKKVTPTCTNVTRIDLTAPPQRSQDFVTVQNIIKDEQTDSSKADLRAIFYRSKDSCAKGLSVLGLLQWYDPTEDSLKEMVDWCERGIAVAVQIGDKGNEAYFHAEKGYFLSTMFVKANREVYLRIKADGIPGTQMVSEWQRQANIEKLNKLRDRFIAEFKEALRLTKEVDDLLLWANVTLMIGQAAGQRASHFSNVGLREQSSDEKSVALNALLAAKEAYSQCDDRLRVGYALYSIANQIRFFGEYREALNLIGSAESIAKEHGDFRLEQRTKLLRKTIESRHIPDYVHGERTEKKK